MIDLNYKIFLIEPNGNYAELDTSGIDFNTTFALSDVKDISAKKDTLSKNLTFQGTKNNNRIFGNVFNQSRVVDSAYNENLFVNFSVNKAVECFVLENSTPILKGFLKFSSATVDKGKITYECIITGNIFNFFSRLGDLQLSDLDFSEYTHVYRIRNIMNTWSNNNFVNGVPTDNHRGYVYPSISYGDNVSPNSEDINKIHLNNFRPAIYTRKYLDKIFAQPVLSGFTYELKGDSTFLENFDSTIIPNNSDLLSQTSTGVQLFAFNKSASQGYSFNDGNTHIPIGGRAVSVVTLSDSPSIAFNTVSPNTGNNFQGYTYTIFTLNRTIKTDMKVVFGTAYAKNTGSKRLKAYLRIWSRPKLATSNPDYGNLAGDFSVITETFLGDLAANGGIANKPNLELNISQTTLNADTEFYISLDLEQPDGQEFDRKFDVSVSNVTLRTPSDLNSVVTYSVNNMDTIKPEPVSNVKQKDFIKSLCSLFNLYTYSYLDRPQHVIFQPYDSYYNFCKPQNIKSTVLDYTNKIDYSGKITFSSYNELAKKYTFTYKADSDYFNTLYTNDYKEIYGQYTETDSLGSQDEKKVELIFSPTPVVNFGNTNRIQPEIYKSTDGINKTPYNSNIRILYFNGQRDCLPYQIGTMSVSNNNYTFNQIIEIPFNGTNTLYGQASHIRYSTGGTPNYLSDLNFGECNRYYFSVDGNKLLNCPNAYDSYYSNQIDELTDLNNVLLDVSVMLTENDISNLDLRVPIFIQNQYGNAYYKVLSVDYQNRNQPSTLKLQKINLKSYVNEKVADTTTPETPPRRPPLIMI
jgi:hypothetical protein